MKNFISLMARHRLSFVFNIVGLSIAFSVVTMVVMQVITEWRIGTDDPKHERIYRIEQKSSKGDQYHLRMAHSLYEQIAQETPEVERFAAFTVSKGVVTGGDERYNDVPTLYLNDDLSKVIDFSMMEGNASSAIDKGNAIIAQSLAQKIYGSAAKAVGQPIDVEGTKLVVSGVYRDFGKESMSPNGVITFGAYGMCSAYFLFRSGVDIDRITRQVNQRIKNTASEQDQVQIRFVALADTYFANEFASGNFLRQGNRTSTLLLLSITLLVLGIAVINFINFSIALAPVRMRALNIRAVFGSSKGALRRSIVYQAMVLSFGAFLLSLLWVELANKTAVVSLFKMSDFSIATNIEQVAWVGVLVLVVGVISGLYPAYYATRFTPAVVLKGSFGRSKTGQALRNALITIQITISTVLITTSLFVYLQNSYLANKELGYDSRNTIVVRGVWDRNAPLMAEKIRNLAIVEQSAIFDGQFGVKNSDADQLLVTLNDTVRLHRYCVAHNFLDLMGVPIVAGRGLLESDRVDSVFSSGLSTYPIEVVVSRAAFKALGSSLDSVVRSADGREFKLVGVVDNLIAHSLYTSGELTMFVQSDYMTSVVAKTGPTARAEALADIRAVAQEVQPYAYTDVGLFDTKIAALYEKERSLALLINLFSFIAIVISLMGIFGLVELETRYRRSEIAVRRVYGASVRSILAGLNRKYALLVVVAFVVSVPVAWYVAQEWLNGFAYRIPISVWVFVVALVIVQLITVLTVTIQSWRVAGSNPVGSLKTE